MLSSSEARSLIPIRGLLIHVIEANYCLPTTNLKKTIKRYVQRWLSQYLKYFHNVYYILERERLNLSVERRNLWIYYICDHCIETKSTIFNFSSVSGEKWVSSETWVEMILQQYARNHFWSSYLKTSADALNSLNQIPNQNFYLPRPIYFL